jgi:23S rRNA (cytosine1962-C5)-methyltransferase
MNDRAAGKFPDPSLVDFGADRSGQGARLEMLGGVLVDRPLPIPNLPPRAASSLWKMAVARFCPVPGDTPSGSWEFSGPLPEPWLVSLPLTPDARHPTIILEVRPAPSGQLGVFLEQADQWRWLARVTPPGSRILSLFAHSGAATIAAAVAGAEVVHVDASRQAIAMARRNAAASGLETAPIRWLCEDAVGFVTRELRRGAAYDGVVLDPPSWGHGPKGQAFSIEHDLEPLLESLADLLNAGRSRPLGPILLTSHSPRWNRQRLCDTLAGVFSGRPTDSGLLECVDAAGRRLPLGSFARQATTP